MGDEPEGLTHDGPWRRFRRVQGGALAADLTGALRQVQRHRAFAAAAVLTLALGIGVTTAMFTIVRRLLIDPVPFRDGDRIARLYEGMTGFGFGGGAGAGTILMMPPSGVARAWHDRSRAFEQIVLLQSHEDVLLGSSAEPELVHAEAMSADVPSFLGIRPVLGRSFAAAETMSGSEPTVLLGFGLWRSRFGGARGVVGHTIDVDGTVRTIIGVMPPGIELPGTPPVGLWLPLVISSDTDIVVPWARLRRGVSVQTAQRELAQIMATMPTHSRAPPSIPTPSAQVVLLRDYLGAHVEKTMALVAGAVGLVLLIACGNVANLLLARAAGRRRELSVRTALGASRGRLLRQFAVESLCITIPGGAVGVLVAWRVMAIVDATRPASLDALDAARLDMTAVWWTVGISVATGLVFGLVPLVIGAGRNPADVLKSVSRMASGGRDASRLRTSLIVGEIALSVTLLVGAALLIRTVRALQQEDVGFDPHNLTALLVSLPTSGHTAHAQTEAVMHRLAEHVRRLPGVVGVTIAGGAPPFSGVMFGGRLEISDRSLSAGDSVRMLGYNTVQPDYFAILRLPVVAGRIFDSDTAAHAAMISTEMAHHFWPGRSALGRRFRPGPLEPWETVVGIVAETRAPGVAAALPYQVYEPLTFMCCATLIVRTRGASPALLATTTRLATRLDPDVRVHAKPIDAEFAALFAGRRFTMMVLSVFASIALVLTAVGLYGVIAYAVVQRTREMGIRLALGATPSAITHLVVSDGAKLAGAGLGMGALLCFVLSRIARASLADVGRLDPAIFLAVGVLMLATAVLASYIPARRAARVDPAIALRSE